MKKLIGLLIVSSVLIIAFPVAAVGTAIEDDMELNTWTFGHTNPGTDCSWSAGYSGADYTSPVRSIRLYVADGGTAGRDADLAFAYQDFPFAAFDLDLKVNYKVAQQTDVPGSGGASSYTDVILHTYDDSGSRLGSYTYRLSTVRGPMYSRNYRPNGNTRWIIPAGISRDADGDIHLPPVWYTLDVNPRQDFAIDWSPVSKVRIVLRAGGAFMYRDVIEVYFDDLELTFYPIPATIEIEPETLDLKSKGKWITAYIELPDGYDVHDIDINTVELNGVVPAENDPKYGFVKNPKSRIGDYDDDGIPDCMVKFNRSDVQDILGVGEEIEITVTGEAAGTPFEGSDIIRVIDTGK